LLVAQRFAHIHQSWIRWLPTLDRPSAYWTSAAPRSYTAVDGSYEIVIDDSICATQAQEQVPLRIYRPVGNGLFPVILFSHGIVAKRDDYNPLGRFWASHGYICIHPQHPDQHEDAEEGPKFRRRFSEAHKAPELWLRRINDLKLVLDNLHDTSAGSLGRLLNADIHRIGGAGHSCGADMIQVMAGVRLHLPPPMGKFRQVDDRLKAALLLSPRGRDWMAPSRRCWRQMKLPTMSMTGSHDLRARRRGGPSWQLEPVRFSPRGGKYGVNIHGANHLSFTLKMRDQTEVIAPACRASDANHPVIFDSIKIASLAFWDAHLKNDAGAKSYLQSDGLPEFSEGRTQIEYR
jgi:dienelactone hydrolase